MRIIILVPCHRAEIQMATWMKALPKFHLILTIRPNSGPFISPTARAILL